MLLDDERSQQLPQLFMYLNLFTKFNNLLIEEFKILKPKMPIEAIFQEVRKIVTAIYQKIFVDFVINIIPPIASEMFSLSSQSNCYDANIDPQVSIESNLALRFFHWFLKPTLGTYDENLFKVPNGLRGKKSVDIPFKMMLDNLTWYDTNVCGIMHGLLDSSWNVGVLSDDVSINLIKSFHYCKLQLTSRFTMNSFLLQTLNLVWIYVQWTFKQDVKMVNLLIVPY